MKKFKKLKSFFIILFLFIITSCGITPTPQGTSEISRFFPFEENTTFVIESEEFPDINQRIFTAFVNGDRIQQSVSAPNLDFTIVLEKDGDSLRQIYSFSEHRIFEDITNILPTTDIIILQEPFIVGHSWRTEMMDGGTSTITGVGLEITTPFRTFTDVIEVTTYFDNTDDYTVIHFAPNYGIILDSYRTTFGENVFSANTHLAQVINGPLEYEMVVFYPNEELTNIDFDIINVQINTNQDFISFFNSIIRENIPSLNHVTLNSINVDRSLSKVHVDFAANFLDFNVGATAESMLLNSLANTFGLFYHVQNFHITINGENYSSGHILFGDGEYIEVGTGL
ncbi:MAG: GerMN domain-containing protein [Defluviitaleaceae bacterium]|nr:GerMN domain-containing protein [Defluviitaleaceae bacterium]